MKISFKTITDTAAKMTIIADANDMAPIKQAVVEKLAQRVKVAGFREGKVPLGLAEKHLDPNTLAAEVLDEAINRFYQQAAVQEKLRPVAQPKIELTKYVPFSELEFKLEVETLGPITLPNYKTLKVPKPTVKITQKDIDEVLARLQTQAATYTEVKRVAKVGDRVWIDFDGKDTKGEPIANASGKDYPLALGSNTFIPGFEDNLVGLKAGDKKEFTITFPKDYGVKALQAKKVTFAVDVKKIEQTKQEPLSDEFAAKVGPFKTLADLKADVKKQLTVEREHQARQELEATILKGLVAKAKLTVPQALVDEQISVVDNEFRQNLTYRGQTFQEYLKTSGQSEQQYRDNELRPAAEERLKAGLILSEIADKEQLTVTPEELEIRLQIMKGQYSDPTMQAELEKPESRRSIASRLLTEKTIAKLIDYATK